FGSPHTIAPEQVRGKLGDIRSDVYAFGAIMYELLSGKPVFPYEHASDAAFGHLAKEPEPPSTKAPRGWITKDVDQFVLGLLRKNPAERPKDAVAVLDLIDGLGRGTTSVRPAAISQEKVDNLVDLLIAAPDDAEAAMALEKAADEGGDAQKIAEAFARAAE